jgi:phage-related holin
MHDSLMAAHERPGARNAVAALVGGALAPLLDLLNRYVFSDWEFFISLCVVIGVDTVLGFWRALRDRRLSSRGFAHIFKKVGFYFLFLAATQAVAGHKVQGAQNDLLRWVDGVCYSIILVREFLSILEHSAAIGIFSAPHWLLQRLHKLAQHDPHDTRNPDDAPRHP